VTADALPAGVQSEGFTKTILNQKFIERQHKDIFCLEKNDFFDCKSNRVSS